MTTDNGVSDRFLDELGDGLKALEGVDMGLANIVTEHILKSTPGENCLEQAMIAIRTLAEARAVLPEEGTDV